MPDTVETGVIMSNLLPLSLRDYYESQLLDVLRAETIFTRFARSVVDFAARDTKTIVFSRAFDLHPTIGALTEAVPFVEGAYLDGEQTSITIAEHGNTIKTNAFHATIQFWDSDDFKTLVREKLGRNLVESLEMMAFNEFITTGYQRYPNAVTARADLSVTDIFIPDYADQSRTNLQSRNAAGLNGGEAPICIIHPRQVRDIRHAAGSDWVEKVQYADPVRFVRGEVGMFDGVRYVANNFCRLPNGGEVVAQSTVDAAATGGATLLGQGGPNSGGLSPVRLTYVTVADGTDFEADQEVSITTASLGAAVLETDENAEHRVILSVDGNNIYFTKPLLVAHATGAYVTEARDLYGGVMIAGPGMVFGVGQMPGVIVPPVIDDFARINRLSWYGIFDFSLLEDDYIEAWITAASTSNYGEA